MKSDGQDLRLMSNAFLAGEDVSEDQSPFPLEPERESAAPDLP